MSDVDHDHLYDVAESQAGYFTAGQAGDAGMDRSTLSYHARPGGRYERIGRGVYRLRHFPSSPHEHVVAAWLPLRGVGAVVSHASALEFYELSDVIPNAVHLTVPRSKRGQRPRVGVRLHTTAHTLEPHHIRQMGGVKVTSPELALVDCLEDGTPPEQIELAIRQALSRGLTTPRRLAEAAATRSARTKQFVDAVVRPEGQ